MHVLDIYYQSMSSPQPYRQHCDPAVSSTLRPGSLAVAVPLAASPADRVICAITIGSAPLFAPMVAGSM
jgi:hypothetical protein